jgi:hypothetical protein
MSAVSLGWECGADIEIEYEHRPYGEFIRGTKAQIEGFGIGTGKAFPGEVGAPKRKLKVTDPRGFPTSISDSLDGRYFVHIEFPGRQQKIPVKAFAPGVELCTDLSDRDEYLGTAAALCAAGIVQMNHLPGQPGMRKTRVHIFADGTFPTGTSTTRHAKSDEPGAMMIDRRSKTIFRVWVNLPPEKQELRLRAQARAHDEYEAKMRALPRPAPLKYRRGRADGNVISLQEARFARMLEARKPVNNADDILAGPNGERRRLLWVSFAESNLLSTIYEHRFEEAVVLLQEMTGQ